MPYDFVKMCCECNEAYDTDELMECEFCLENNTCNNCFRYHDKYPLREEKNDHICQNCIESKEEENEIHQLKDTIKKLKVMLVSVSTNLPIELIQNMYNSL